MVFFDSCNVYIESQTTLLAKINAIDAIISALESAALAAAAGEQTSEYKLNDGQTIIQKTYRGSAAIATAINSFETIKQRYVNRYNGRTTRLVDSKNFRNPYGSC